MTLPAVTLVELVQVLEVDQSKEAQQVVLWIQVELRTPPSALIETLLLLHAFDGDSSSY